MLVPQPIKKGAYCCAVMQRLHVRCASALRNTFFFEMQIQCKTSPIAIDIRVPAASLGIDALIQLFLKRMQCEVLTRSMVLTQIDARKRSLISKSARFSCLVIFILMAMIKPIHDDNIDGCIDVDVGSLHTEAECCLPSSTCFSWSQSAKKQSAALKEQVTCNMQHAMSKFSRVTCDM